MPKKTKLITDFRDYYDHMFYDQRDTADYRFVRIAHDSAFSISKTKQFDILCKAFPIPHVGFAEKLPASVNKVVVYTDLYAHQGEGKLLMSRKEAISKYPYTFCSEYIEGKRSGQSIRFLQIGNKGFSYKYWSKTDWRSNYGEDLTISFPIVDNFWAWAGDIYRGHTISRWDVEFSSWPMFAIDFVQDSTGKLYAIDFNTAPGLKHTGMDKILKASELYQEITNYFVERDQQSKEVKWVKGSRYD